MRSKSQSQSLSMFLGTVKDRNVINSRMISSILLIAENVTALQQQQCLPLLYQQFHQFLRPPQVPKQHQYRFHLPFLHLSLGSCPPSRKWIQIQSKFPQDKKSRFFWFRNQAVDNMLRSMLIGVTVWSFLQILMLWTFR